MDSCIRKPLVEVVSLKMTFIHLTLINRQTFVGSLEPPFFFIVQFNIPKFLELRSRFYMVVRY